MSAGFTAGQAFTGELDRATAAILPSSEVTHVHLLRHGNVAELGQRIVRGQIDAPLSSEGREQHARLVRWYAENEQRPDAILSSDLSRCRELALALGSTLGIEARIEPRLREQSMGRWEGLSWAAITAQEPEAVTAYWADYARARPSGGESLDDLSARVGEWWTQTLQEHRGQRIVVVTHIGVIRVLVCLLLGLRLDEALRLAPATASHSALTWSTAGAVLQSFGERPWLYQGRARATTSSQARARGLRLALSGSAGTGKTTLGLRLASELGLPFLAERMRTRLEAGFDLHDLGPNEWRALMRSDWEAQRAEEERCTQGFVSDRSSLDYAAFWLHYGLQDDERATDAWMRERALDARRYDSILLFPWGALPLVEDGVRSTNRWIQLRFQSILEGLCERHAGPGQVLRVPSTPDFHARMASVLAELGVKS